MRNKRLLGRILREELANNAIPQLFNTKETAKMLGISPGTLTNRRVIQQGPKVTMVGGVPRYRLSEINTWLEDNTR